MILEVKPDNLYITGKITNFADGTALLLRTQLEYVPSANDIYVPLPETLNLEDVSYQEYDNSKNWWILADVNNIFNPFDLQGIDSLVVPDLDKLLATSI